MASSIRTSAVSPTSMLTSYSPELDEEPGDTSSLALVNSTSIHSLDKVRKSRSLYTFKENTPPSQSLRFRDCNVMDDASVREMARRARKMKSQAALASTPENRELSKKKSQYYGAIFAYREPITSARDRVTRDSLVMAELKTNIILKDEYTIITDLSSHISVRYQRPESSILISIIHSACLLVGGSFDPAYILTITALPSQIAPATNKRNALLTASFLKESLGVPEKRGIIRFAPISEENLASGGRTVLGDIEHLEQRLSEDYDGGLLQRNLSRTNKNRKKKSMALMSMTMPKSMSIRTGSKTPTPSTAGVVSPMGMPFASDESSTIADKDEVEREGSLEQTKVRPKMKARKSFMALFGK